jgi:hypothetical protein
MLRTRLLQLLVLAMVVGWTGLASRTALAAGPDFSLSASPPSVGVPAGRTSSTQITVTPSGGFTAGVTLSVSGLPAGVTSRLVPAPSGGITVLQLTASSSVATSITTITVTAAGGGLTHTLAIPVTVAGFVSDFAVFVNPVSLTVSPGSGVASAISATPQTGFTGIPAFSASGLPSGVTASFSPTVVNGNGSSRATLTLTAAGAAPAASATVTVTGMAGSAMARATISLTVTGGGATFTQSAHHPMADLLP